MHLSSVTILLTKLSIVDSLPFSALTGVCLEDHTAGVIPALDNSSSLHCESKVKLRDAVTLHEHKFDFANQSEK